MNVYDAVCTLLAVREYQDQPIPPDLTRRIVDAGWLTASSMNKQPWHFIVVEDRQTLARLGEIARSGAYIAEASLAVVVAIEDTRFSVSDASRAIQSMMLTAWAEGVGSNWVGFFGLDEVDALLGIPADLKVLAVVPFGYPREDLGKGKKNRKPLEQVVHRGRFGRPFEENRS